MFRRKQMAPDPATATGDRASTKPSGPAAPSGQTPAATVPAAPAPDKAVQNKAAQKEIGGPPGPDPTRYGDWESKGRCIDF